MKLETLEYKRLVRMNQVGAELRHRLPALAGELLEALGPALGEVATRTAFLVSARGRKRGLARIKKRARAALRSDLAAIKSTALAIALETPDLDPKRFRTPTTGDQRLLTAARAAAQDAAPLAAALIEHGLPVDFLDGLNRHIQDFVRIRKDYAAAARASEQAESQIEETMKDARPMAMRLDVIVRNALRNDGPALTAWNKASQFGRAKPSKREDVLPDEERPAVLDSAPVEAA